MAEGQATIQVFFTSDGLGVGVVRAAESESEQSKHFHFLRLRLRLGRLRLRRPSFHLIVNGGVVSGIRRIRMLFSLDRKVLRF